MTSERDAAGRRAIKTPRHYGYTTSKDSTETRTTLVCKNDNKQGYQTEMNALVVKIILPKQTK